MAKKYEGSAADIAEDKKGAKKLGVGMKAYEETARDKAEDKRGQAAMGMQAGGEVKGWEGGFVLPHIKAKREGR